MTLRFPQSLPRRFGRGSKHRHRSYSQIKGANDRLNIGAIGAGIQGSSHSPRTGEKQRSRQHAGDGRLRHLQTTAWTALSNSTGGKPYKNYHDLLANKDIDYVLIASPRALALSDDARCTGGPASTSIAKSR